MAEKLDKTVATSPRKVVDVVNISSVAGRFATAQVAVYNATKFGVTAVTEAWRQEFTIHTLFLGFDDFFYGQTFSLSNMSRSQTCLNVFDKRVQRQNLF